MHDGTICAQVNQSTPPAESRSALIEKLIDRYRPASTGYSSGSRPHGSPIPFHDRNSSNFPPASASPDNCPPDIARLCTPSDWTEGVRMKSSGLEKSQGSPKLSVA